MTAVVELEEWLAPLEHEVATNNKDDKGKPAPVGHGGDVPYARGEGALCDAHP